MLLFVQESFLAALLLSAHSMLLFAEQFLHYAIG
jgi:hypothetical protein